MPIHLEIVTAERVVLSEDVDSINAPTREGRVGILPRHEPLLTILEPGELAIVQGGVRTEFAVSGGFMEVLPNRVTILADTALRADEIDEARAEQARVRAEEMLKQKMSDREMAEAEMQLRRAMVELKVAQMRRLKK
jgi:F-type H+-transporting ATPase subunit epsilon